MTLNVGDLISLLQKRRVPNKDPTLMDGLKKSSNVENPTTGSTQPPCYCGKANADFSALFSFLLRVLLVLYLSIMRSVSAEYSQGDVCPFGATVEMLSNTLEVVLVRSYVHKCF